MRLGNDLVLMAGTWFLSGEHLCSAGADLVLCWCVIGISCIAAGYGLCRQGIGLCLLRVNLSCFKFNVLAINICV